MEHDNRISRVLKIQQWKKKTLGMDAFNNETLTLKTIKLRAKEKTTN